MTMRAIVEWDGYSWVAEVDGHPNVFMSAKRLQQVPPRLSEVMHLMTAKQFSDADWELDIHLSDHEELAKIAAELKAQRARVEDLERSLTEQTADVVRQLRELGMNLRDIGAMTGVSHQRVHQLASRKGAAA